MEQIIGNDDLGTKVSTKLQVPMKETINGIKQNKCKQCNYASSQAGNLWRHLKIHSGEKSNKCKQCDYASSYASNLRTHMKTHSGEKANSCDQCEYASSEAANLRRHLRKLTGEKPKIYLHCGDI